MLNKDDRYSHLYKTGIYVPPSIIRQIEKAKPSQNEVFNNININRGNSLEAITNQSKMENFLNTTLRGKDMYSNMKNKIMYSLSSDVTTHASLNKL